MTEVDAAMIDPLQILKQFAVACLYLAIRMINTMSCSQHVAVSPYVLKAYSAMQEAPLVFANIAHRPCMVTEDKIQGTRWGGGALCLRL